MGGHFGLEMLEVMISLHGLEGLGFVGVKGLGLRFGGLQLLTGAINEKIEP